MPWFRAKLRSEIPPFVQSIGMILWAFTARIMILAGAEWSPSLTIETLQDGVAAVDALQSQA